MEALAWWGIGMIVAAFVIRKISEYNWRKWG